MAEKKKHHYVSAHLLRQFTDERGFLEVLPLDGKPSRRTAAANLGLRNHGHTVRLLDPSNPNLFEDVQAELEGKAASLIQELATRTDDELTDDERDLFQRFMVLHMFRHPRMMRFAMETADLDLGELEGTEFGTTLQSDMLVHAVSWAAYLGDPTHDPDANGARWEAYRAEFSNFEWYVLRWEKPSLVVGDSIVTTSAILRNGRLPTPDRSYGVGLHKAERITMPLGPQLGLLLSRGGRLSRLSAPAFNRATAGGSDEFIAFSTTWPAASPELHSNVTALVAERAGRTL